MEDQSQNSLVCGGWRWCPCRHMLYYNVPVCLNTHRDCKCLKGNILKQEKKEVTESQNSRGWKGPLWVTQPNPPTEAGSPRAGCTGPCPGGSGISPEKETPPPHDGLQKGLKPRFFAPGKFSPPATEVFPTAQRLWCLQGMDRKVLGHDTSVSHPPEVILPKITSGNALEGRSSTSHSE